MYFQNIPIILRIYEARKIVRAENSVVQTTSCPISSASAPISCDIGTLETATGVQKQATKLANCAPLYPPIRRAPESPTIGTTTTRATVPKII